MTPMFTGVGGVNREVNKMFTGVNGANREVTRLLTTHNGVNRDVLRPPPLNFINTPQFLPNHTDELWRSVYTRYAQGSIVPEYNGWYFASASYDFMIEYFGYMSANTYNISKYTKIRIKFKNISDVLLSNDGYSIHFVVSVHPTIEDFQTDNGYASFDIVGNGYRPFGQEYTVDLPIDTFRTVSGMGFDLNRPLHVTLMMHHPSHNAGARMYITEFTLY